MFSLIVLPAVFPLIFGVLALESANSASKDSKRFRLWLVLTGVSALLPIALFLVASWLFSRTDCTGGTTFLGCNLTSESYGEALFAASWVGLLSTPLTILLGSGFVIAAFVKRLRTSNPN